MSKSQSVIAESQFSQALSALNKIGKTLTSIQDPSKVLKEIAEEAKEVLGADIVDLYEYDQAHRKFVIPPILVGKRLNPDITKTEIYRDDVVAKVVNERKSDYFSDAQGNALLTAGFDVPRADIPVERFVVREKILSSASLLLQAGEEIVGVMFINYRTRQKFDNEQKSLIESFSNLAAIAIHNARLWKSQRDQLGALKEIIDVIGTKENPLSEILEQTAKLFSVSNGSISRLTEDGQSLQHKILWVAGKLETGAEDIQSIRKGIVGYIVRERKAYFRTGDTSKVEFYDPRYSTTKSELAILLKNAFGGIIGVLNLESDLLDFFTEEDENLCESFAHAASAAIQQSDLLDGIQSLHYLTESYTLKDLLDRILNNLTKIIGENTASSINLYDPENDNFYAFDGVGPTQEFTNSYLLIPPRKNGTGRYVLNTKAPLYYEDVNNIPAGLPKIRPESMPNGIVSFAVLPLIYRDRIVGTLFIHKIKESIKFTEDIRRILETYASQAALAIHNAQRLMDVQPLKEILEATASESRDFVLKSIAEKTVNVMASDYASIWIPEQGSDDLVREAIFVRPGEENDILPGSERIKIDGSINGKVYRNKDAIIIGDVDKEKEKEKGDYHRIYRKAKSEIVVPLIYQDQIMGTLNTESQRLGAFSELDKETLRVFADVAAIAIKLTRDREEVQKQDEEIRKRSNDLFHMNYRLERRNASFEALTEIGQQLTASVERGEREILSIIHQQASRIMDTNNMYIALYEPDKDMVYFELAFLDGNSVDINAGKGWGPRFGGNGRTEWIIRHKTPILTYTRTDAEEWYKQPDAHEYIGESFASWLGVPIVFGEEVLGVIATYHKTEEYKYDPDDLKILTLMGRQAAIALRNARLVSRLNTMRALGDDLIGALSV